MSDIANCPFGALGDIHGDFDSVRAIAAAPGRAILALRRRYGGRRRRYEAVATALLDQGQQRELRRDCRGAFPAL